MPAAPNEAQRQPQPPAAPNEAQRQPQPPTAPNEAQRQPQPPAAPNAAAESGVTGVWTAYDVGFPPWTLTLKADGAKLSGTVQQGARGASGYRRSRCRWQFTMARSTAIRSLSNAQTLGTIAP
jgi:hypothetical protein